MQTLKARMAAGETLAGTFVKTPSVDVIEVLAKSSLDFIALDAEHSPFDRGRLDNCLAIARALNFPALVRVPSGDAAEILKALDSGATGVIVPHVYTVEKARDIAKWSHFGHMGRGFAGSTRWAGFATRPMAEVLKQSQEETIVIAQIEEPEGVDAIDDIAGVSNIDGLFVGPADLSVCLGTTDPTSKPVRDAMRKVGQAAEKHQKTFMTFAPTADTADELRELGVSMFFIASEQTFMMQGASAAANALHAGS